MKLQGAELTIYHDIAERRAKTISRPELIKIAGKVAGEASGGAPRLTGKYAGSFAVDTSRGVRVVSADNTALHKEYGTSTTPAHAALTQAAMRYGQYRGTRPR